MSFYSIAHIIRNVYITCYHYCNITRGYTLGLKDEVDCCSVSVAEQLETDVIKRSSMADH